MGRYAVSIFAAAILSAAIVSSSADAQGGPREMAVGEILSDVVDKAADAVEDVVKDNAGIDIDETGYSPDKKHTAMPAHGCDEGRRELKQLKKGHDRKIKKLKSELERKLAKARKEFKREAGKEDKPGKIENKRDKLQEKVDAARDTFDEKVREENRRFDEKREKIVERCRGKEKHDKNDHHKKGKGKGKGGSSD